MKLRTQVRLPLVLAALSLIAACADNIPVGVDQPSELTMARGVTMVGGIATITGDNIAAGYIVVRFREGAARSEIAAQYGAVEGDTLLLDRAEILEVPVGQEREIASQLSQHPDVEFAEPDQLFSVGRCETSATCDLPDGMLWPLKWDLYNTGSFVFTGNTIVTGKADADIDWAELYDYLGANFAGDATLVGILDTGIRATHAMFVGKILGGRRFTSDMQSRTNFNDDNGHGTRMAGLSAGRATGSVPGVAYPSNVKLLIGKVCNSAGICLSSAIANGITWAVDNGANVINLSLGFSALAKVHPDSVAVMQTALKYAAKHNVLPVCSAGNDGLTSGYSGGISYPARLPECVAVGATNWSDTKATYSNFGSELAISAPGGDRERLNFSAITSASVNGDNSYGANLGTSEASAEVTGAAALLFATGWKDANKVRQRLIQTADDIEAAGWDKETGWGRLNVYRAVTGLEPNAPPVSHPGGPYFGHKGAVVQFDGSASRDPNGKPLMYAWSFGDPASGTSNTSTETKPTHTYLRAGTYTVTLAVTDAANLTKTSTTTATIPNIVPVVSFGGATILQGETYSTSGSFEDADPDTWTAVVDYGSGMYAEALALATTKAFNLSHRYMKAGQQTVTVIVSDDDGGVGRNTASVIIWTPQHGIQALLLDVLAASDLPHGTVNSLSVKLRAAQASLDRDNPRTALNQLNAFLNELAAVVKTGRMSSSLGAHLAASEDRIEASIEASIDR